MLRDHLPTGRLADAGDILDRFLAWVAEQGLTPYAAQEEALLELLAGRHVVLSTPTGSGKSLVALGLHFLALCRGERSFYTAPVKALASEKFFALCRELGAEQVGLMTGDATVNPGAPVVCCTAEVLEQMALREGAGLDAPHVVMDEFHFYADRDRGRAWQVPLLELPRTRFLLMSATLGNTAAIERDLERRSGRPVVHVHGTERPVPLDYEYRETPLQETVEALLEEGRAPIYIVHFTHRDAAESAQGLTSARIATREQRARIAEALVGVRFDTPYGKDVRRFLRHGIGIHHAGLLPRYRLLVERLAQQGLLRVVCGTDTLGVGVNVPIRTVLFTRLCKYDGERVRILSVRDFRQIAGRAGRRGFDDRGSVVALAPPHVIEAKRARERAAASGRRARGPKKRAPRGIVPWSRETFDRLVTRPPEPLESRFEIGHGTLVALLRRTPGDDPASHGYRAVIELVERAHEGPARKRALRREAARHFRALRRAGVIELLPDPARRGRLARVRDDLQHDFSLHQTLSLYLVDAVTHLDPEAPDHALDVITLTECILEDPRPVLEAQRRRAREALLAELKAQGVPFDERIARLDEVTHPQPRLELIAESFERFEREHPWVDAAHIRPKSVAREMVEREEPFADFVRRYGLQRSEGVLLRYLAQVVGALERTVPAPARTEALDEAVAFLRATCVRADASLVEAWETERAAGAAGAAASAGDAGPRPPADPARDERALRARVRTELRQLVRALSRGDAGEAAQWVRPAGGEEAEVARMAEAIAGFEAEHGRIAWTPAARAAHHTVVKRVGPRRWDVYQSLLDGHGESVWCVEGEVDLAAVSPGAPESPLVRVRRIGPSSEW